MKTVLLSMSAAAYKNPVVCIDDQVLRFTKQKNGESTCTYQTDKDEVLLTVTHANEMRSKYWFWWGLLWFFLSGLGIFNPHYDKKARDVNCQIRLTLNEVTNLRITFNRFAEGTRAVECVRDCPGEEYDNVYSVDKRIRKRCRLLGVAEMFIWFAVIGLAVYFILKLIIKF